MFFSRVMNIRDELKQPEAAAADMVAGLAGLRPYAAVAGPVRRGLRPGAVRDVHVKPVPAEAIGAAITALRMSVPAGHAGKLRRGVRQPRSARGDESIILSRYSIE